MQNFNHFKLNRPFMGLWRSLLELPHSARQSLLLTLDLILIPLALYLALVARLGMSQIPDLGISELVCTAITMLGTVLVFRSLGLYRAIVRFMGGQAIIAVLKGVALSTALLAFTALLTGTWIPRSLPFIYFLIAVALIGGSRLLVRAYYQTVVRGAGRITIIYGAGEAGRNLMSAIQHGQRYRGVLFVDDDPALLNRTVGGILVKHPDQLPHLIESTGARYVFLAMPNLDKSRRREIIDSLVDLHVHVKTVPSIEEIFEGNSLVNIQEVDVDDLLGRMPIKPNKSLMQGCVRDKTVLVTGAGGSIGGELSRQIVSCSPRHLILIEQAEYQLYKIEHELKQIMAVQGKEIQLTCLLASINDHSRMTQIFDTYSIDGVYHAAAYKHVPMVEHNILEGLKNNVLGTYQLVKLAAKYRISRFTLISTDKAVRPTNVMGASKRFAELILQAYATMDLQTRFCMVRFGNVLGSSGSVVPVFREQIRSGGPVTVTHPDVIRYFMTIPEAAQLVLQASAMSKGGDVFLLDMGEPVKIVELAKRMILLMGREIKDENNEDGDVEIEFTGLRSGEKLYEELLIGDNPSGTDHPKIMRAQEKFIEPEKLEKLLSHLEQACVNGACDIALKILCEAIPEYRLSVPLKDTIWSQKKSNADSVGNVIEGEFR